MIKVYVFNKSNDVFRVDIFEKLFWCNKISLTCCAEIIKMCRTVKCWGCNLSTFLRQIYDDDFIQEFVQEYAYASVTFGLILLLWKIRVGASCMTSSETFSNNSLPRNALHRMALIVFVVLMLVLFLQEWQVAISVDDDVWSVEGTR